MLRRAAVVATVALVLFASPLIVLAQTAAIRYVYDDLGRLAAVVGQQGNVATYRYDSVGNLLEIGRVNAADLPGSVGITYFTPTRGVVGSTVTIFGKGFSATPSQNAVTFNGAAATVTAAEANVISTTVPVGATSGVIGVTVPLGSAVSSTSFVVGAATTVSPATVTLSGGATQQFQALEGGTPTSAVTWAVNGITGGDAQVARMSMRP